MSSGSVATERTTGYASGTFLPGDSARSLDALLNAVWRNRLTTFLVVHTELFSLCPAECDATGFLSAAYDVINLQEEERRALINHPVFQVWVSLTIRDLNARLTGRTDDPEPVRNRII